MAKSRSFGRAGTAVVITGLADIDKRLKSLPGRVQKKVVRQAMRAGLKVMAAAVKADAPVLTGTTKANVKVRAVKRRKRGSIELEVRIAAVDALKRTSATTGKTVFYPAIVEYLRNPFMHRAYASTGEQARQVTMAHLRAGLDREIAKK